MSAEWFGLGYLSGCAGGFSCSNTPIMPMRFVLFLQSASVFTLFFIVCHSFWCLMMLSLVIEFMLCPLSDPSLSRWSLPPVCDHPSLPGGVDVPFGGCWCSDWSDLNHCLCGLVLP